MIKRVQVGVGGGNYGVVWDEGGQNKLGKLDADFLRDGFRVASIENLPVGDRFMATLKKGSHDYVVLHVNSYGIILHVLGASIVSSDYPCNMGGHLVSWTQAGWAIMSGKSVPKEDGIVEVLWKEKP